jgi:hypothetical protein
MGRRPAVQVDLEERILAAESKCAAATRDRDRVAEWELMAELWSLYEQRELLTAPRQRRPSE